MSILDKLDFYNVKLNHITDGVIKGIEVEFDIKEEFTQEQADTIYDVLVDIGKIEYYVRSFALVSGPGKFLICIS